MSWKKRILQNEISQLNSDEVFVFGSNLSGKHGKGAAKTALKWGAKYGEAVGLQGNTYAIPTKNENAKESLSVKEIKIFVDDFIEFAKNNKNLTFFVTEIGTGYAKHKKEDIAVLFEEAVFCENIHLSQDFWAVLLKNYKTVGDLKNLIKDIPDDTIVILEKDRINNVYSPLKSLDENVVYMPYEHDPNFGDVIPLWWDASETNFTQKEWEKVKQRSKVLLLSSKD